MFYQYDEWKWVWISGKMLIKKILQNMIMLWNFITNCILFRLTWRRRRKGEWINIKMLMNYY